MSKKKTSLNILLLVLLIAVLSAYYFYVFIPLNKEITKLNLAHDIDTTIINTIIPYQKDDSALKNKRDQLLKEMDENDISKKIVGASGLSSEIVNASNLSGVVINEVIVGTPVITPKQAESNPSYHVSNVIYNVKFNSDYNRGKQFLSYFENNKKANVTIEEVAIDESENNYLFTVKFILNYYSK